MRTKLNLSIALVLALLVSNVALAKEKKSNTPIYYLFPVEVDSLINKYINSIPKVPKDKKGNVPFFILLSTVRDTTSLLICERKSGDSVINSLLDRSNRITKKKGIPILLGEDIRFCSDLNTFEWPADGSPIRRTIVMFSGQSIEFYMVRHQATIMSYEYYYP